MKVLAIFKKKKPKSHQKNDTPAKQHPSSGNIGLEQMEYIIRNSTNTAFQEAWRQHWKDLGEAEKLAWSSHEINSPLHAQKTLEDIDRLHREQSIARSVGDKTLTFLRAIESLMAGVAIGIQADPTVSSIVVGVIRVVINAAVKYLEYYEKLTAMMEYLAELLNTLDVFDGIKSGEPRLHDTLVSIYSNVLAFCKHARRAYFDKQNIKTVNPIAVLAKVQWTPFEEEFRHIRLNLEQQVANLNTMSAAIIMKSTSALEENMKQRRLLEAQNERRDFLEWIFHGEEEIHMQISKKRYKSTGSWLVRCNTFNNWSKHPDKHILWLNGPAGAGKSVLSSVVINHLIEQNKFTKNTVVYKYFKGEDDRTQSAPLKMISNLAKQLCSNLQILPEAARKIYYNYRMNARRPSFDDIEGLFLQCSKLFEYMFVVLDGLDECEERDRKIILKFVCDISVQCNSVKIYVASRKEIDILRVFRRHEVFYISPGGPLTLEDIETFVKHRVATDLSHVNPDIRDSVTKTLIEKSQGMYLWVDLQLNDLERVPEHDIKRQLEMLPEGLENTYLSMFRKMMVLPQTTRSLLQMCFLFAFYSKHRMSSDVFIDAISLKHKMDLIEENPYNADIIMEMTSGLIEVSGFGLIRVKPVHFSLQEFFTCPTTKHPLDLQELLPNSDTANARMAIMCLQHLMIDMEPADIISTCLGYCGGCWDSHIQSLTSIPEELWTILDHIFLKEPALRKRIMSWKYYERLFDFPNLRCIGDPQFIDSTMFMRCTKLHKIPAIWNRYKEVDEVSRDYPKEYLFLASYTGLDDVLKNIMSQGINVNKTTLDRHTALHYAILSEDHENTVSTVEILLDAGADWNFDARHVPSGERLKDYRTPLNSALQWKNFSAIRTIIKHESFNFATYMKTRPAENAKWIKELIEQGADINQRDEYGDTVLRIARDDGRQDIVEILEELGAQE